MDNENMEQGASKRMRRTSEQIRADKIRLVEEKIAKHQDALRELEAELEDLKRPPMLSKSEKQALLKKKISSGMLSEQEAYQLGYEG